MRTRTEHMVCDRRILKAFYTQYVAVLLIILVFSVGAFQRASAHAVTSAPRALVITEPPSIGRLEVEVEFDASGALTRNPTELEAIAEVIKEHDVRATVTLALPPQDEEAELFDVEVVLARIDSLRSYLVSRGLSESDFNIYLGGSDARPNKVTVEFEEVSRDNLPL